MITIEQIKAARSLLNWNQQVLADSASMSKTALANIERGSSSPRIESLAALKKALEDGGVEFTEGPGVKLRGDVLYVQVLKGSDSLLRLWSDIYQTLDKGEERLINNLCSERFSTPTFNKFEMFVEKFIVVHYFYFIGKVLKNLGYQENYFFHF